MSADWLLGSVFVGPSGRLAITGGEIAGLSTIGEVLNGLLTAVLGEPVDCFPIDLVLLLLLAAWSSSSDEISTTIWADITGGYRPLARLRILSLRLPQALE